MGASFRPQFALSLALALAIGTSAVAHAAKLQLNVEASAIKTLKEAEIAERARRWEDAKLLYQQAILLPGVQEAGAVGLARTLTAIDDLEAAEETLRKFLKYSNPFSLDVRLALADIAIQKGDWKAARNEVERVRKIRPDYYPMIERLALTSFQVADFKNAVLALDKILETFPDNTKALSLRSRALGSLGRHAASVEDLLALIELEPQQVAHYLNAGKSYWAFKEKEEAAEYFKTVLHMKEALPADISDAHLWLAKLAFEEGKKLLAEQHLEKSYQLAPSIFTAQQLLKIQYAAQRYDRAEATARKLLELDPHHTEAAKTLVQVFNHTGKRDRLGLFLRDYVEAHPKQEWALLTYVRILNDVDQLNAAENAISRAFNEAGTSAQVPLLYVKVLEKEGRLEDIRGVLKKAHQKFPKDDRILFNLALLEEKSGNVKEAIKYYSAVSDQNPDWLYRSRVNQALLLEKKGKIETAYELLQSVAHVKRESETENAAFDAKLNELASHVDPSVRSSRMPASQPPQGGQLP